MNGQLERQRITRDLLGTIPFAAVVETGSFRGHSTEFFAGTVSVPIWSVEANRRFALYARRRCAPYRNVTIVNDDSRSFLRAFIAQYSSGRPVFYYLDAHWLEDLPLKDELTLILASSHPAVVMVDDFQVPDDAGYGYDDYGATGALTPDLLDGLGLERWGTYFPATSSKLETGARRGSVVLVHPDLQSQVRPIPSLRPAPDRY